MGDIRTFSLPGDGLKCGGCSAPLLSVSRTVRSPGFITRERICAVCGKLNTTTERVIHTRSIYGRFHDPCE